MEEDKVEDDCCFRSGVDLLGLKLGLTLFGLDATIWECGWEWKTVCASVLGVYVGSPLLALLAFSFGCLGSGLDIRMGETKGLASFWLTCSSFRRLAERGDDMVAALKIDEAV